MKKLVFALPFVALLAVGCSSKTAQVQTNTPNQGQNNQQTVATNEPLTSLDEATPIVRNLQPGQYSNTKTYTFEGITFSVPWSDLIKQTNGQASLKLQLGNNKTVAVLQKESSPNQDLTEFLGNAQQSATVKQLLGSNNFQSSYTFNKFVWGTTPEIVAKTQGQTQTIETALLNLKRTLLVKPQQDNGYIIYNFTTPYVRGFQYGSLATDSKIIDVYDNNNYSYTFLINGTQPEVDYILSSIKSK